MTVSKTEVAVFCMLKRKMTARTGVDSLNIHQVNNNHHQAPRHRAARNTYERRSNGLQHRGLNNKKKN